ncbi:hypothetical protein [Providencia burhodogranariea]|uniref:Uncharacterized protein n=1 Tax=Providencia burhodogranariea DSM 19968 TaxID=1141662 RepID=K8X221_9GAMM|nr:hypothetical protein [Providencia burhodogranariea]EKT63722.1 hypothetical protein OOA_05092 [Providencia burhodogranariea DSM 19968]
MPSINFSDKFVVSIHNSIGGNISTATAKGLLDKIKNIANGGREIPKGIITALTKKAESTRNKGLAETIKFTLADIHSSKAISILNKGIAIVENDISNYKNKNKNTTEIDNNAGLMIRKYTTKVLSDNKVDKENTRFRLFVSAHARENNVDLQLPKKINENINTIKPNIKELSRLSDLLIFVKKSFILRLINDSDTDKFKFASTEKKKEFIENSGIFFEKSFSKDLVEFLLTQPEIDTIFKDKGIKPFDKEEVDRLLPSDIFSKRGKAVSNETLIASVLNEIEKEENKLSELNNTLNEAKSMVYNNEISAAINFIKLPNIDKNGKQSKEVKQLINVLSNILDNHKKQHQESNDAPKQIKKLTLN